MIALKMTYDYLPAVVQIPEKFQRHPAEIIIMALDDMIENTAEPKKDWPRNFFAETAGCFVATPIRRAEQSTPEARDEIQ